MEENMKTTRNALTCFTSSILGTGKAVLVCSDERNMDLVIG
jgi:hypothetical protein